MPLSITVTRSWNFPAGRPVTLAALRLGALPGVSIAGLVGGADIADGAITPPKVSPGPYFYGVLTGTNVYATALNPPMTAYVDGIELLGKVGASNTAAATATLEVNGLGAKQIYHRNGQLVKAGDLVASDIIRFRFNTSRNPVAGGWDIMEVLPSSTIRPAINPTIGVGTPTIDQVQTVANVPPLTGYQVGQLVLVKVGADLTNSTSTLFLNCDGIGTRLVRLPGGVALPRGIWQAGQTYLLYDDGAQFILLTKEGPTAIVGAARGLVIQNTSGSQITVRADELIVKHSGTGHPFLLQNVNTGLDISGGVGPSGYETAAARGANRWYYLWVISKGFDLPSCVLEESAGSGAAPLGPDLSDLSFAGYEYMALVGVVRLNSIMDIVPFCQYDRSVAIAETNIFTARAAGAANDYQVLVDGAPVGFTDYSNFAGAVPYIAVRCRGTIGASSGAANFTIAACTTAGLDEESNAIGAVTVAGAAAAAINGFTAAGSFEVPVRGSPIRNIQWKSPNATANNRLNISGYTI